MNIEHLLQDPTMLHQFTLSSVEQGEHDLAILRSMAALAFATIGQLPPAGASPDSPIFIQTHVLPGGRTFRLAINTTSPMTMRDLLFVGFISKKHSHVPQVVQQRIDETDRAMLLELATQPAVVSYASLQLAEQDWYNLVMFSQAHAKRAILSIPVHHDAAYELAPQYYQWIRLHHGMIQQHAPSFELVLHTTKYYTFHSVAAAPSIHEQVHQPAHVIASAAVL